MTITVVTGANSGIGRATAIHLAQQGHTVYGTVRSVDKAAKLQSMSADAGVEVNLVELDVADDESVRAGFARILEATDGVVDVLVNNAGIGGNAVAEECDTSTYLEVMNVNLCGAVRCLQQVLPGMRARRGGAIVNITSVAGRVAAIAQSPYVTSKWAFEGLSEGLAQELAPFGIRVAIIEPGIVETAIFEKAVQQPIDFDSPYFPITFRTARFLMAGAATPSSPDDVAEVIWRAVTTDTPVLRATVGPDAAALAAHRPQLSDETWVAALSDPDDAAWRARMLEWGATEVPPM
jgi:NAD(P)-dependent dehydrogenase (short-subunit alcohol dehydrogenase family)